MSTQNTSTDAATQEPRMPHIPPTVWHPVEFTNDGKLRHTMGNGWSVVESVNKKVRMNSLEYARLGATPLVWVVCPHEFWISALLDFVDTGNQVNSDGARMTVGDVFADMRDTIEKSPGLHFVFALERRSVSYFWRRYDHLGAVASRISFAVKP